METTPGPVRAKGDGASTSEAAEVVELDRAEAMRLLASVGHGRVVFSEGALPAIRPVNHLVDGGRVIVRTRVTAKLTKAMRSNPTSHVVVAYQADDLDPQRRAGWSVVVTGVAITVTDPVEIARYEQLLHPWVNKADTVVAIEPEIVTGIRIVSSGSAPDHT
ncbi:MAG TPA: pyridoxamine 5'-phosphate oxidase family protein [Mycobacterium sp.]|nr:pyridoxamine 5'-phosphate oxidase family protein [Mycobacterium sp.]HUH71072.1 pyridoxamine 5'-phosphate oxidase family protein [Mycobacterium sp.]